MIKSMTVSLLQHIVLHAILGSTAFAQKISAIKFHKSILARSSETWTADIEIPSVATTSNGSCRIIDVSYSLVLNVNPAGFTKSKNVSIPIVIGTIPIYEINSALSYHNYLLGPFGYPCLF